MGNNNITCIIDCRLDKSSANDYLTLSLWGKTCFEYICDTVELVDLFSEVHLLTDSPKIKYIAENRSLSVVSEIPIVDTIMLISGKAIFLTKETIEDVINSYTGGRLISEVSVNKFNYSNGEKRFYKNTEFVPSNAFCISDGKLDSLEFYYTLKDEEALTINSTYDFELALILKKKQIGRIVLTQSILDRIEEKKENFILSPSRNTICLVGHSQLDNWNLCNINGIAVRNCGIRGISSVDYKRYILDRNLLNCDSDIFVVMHGTNDIVDSYNDEDIVKTFQRLSTTSDIIIRQHVSFLF